MTASEKYRRSIRRWTATLDLEDAIFSLRVLLLRGMCRFQAGYRRELQRELKRLLAR